jgi:glycosyltransferase involved in cell wall biosynthesis
MPDRRPFDTVHSDVDWPLVSVVLPTRDRASWVARAIESVLAQSHRPLEVLVVDDGSRDETRQLLAQFGSRITVLSQPAGGVYPARNLGLGHAKGEFVAFIDSDDEWHPHRLASQLPLMRPPNVGLVFGDAARIPDPPTVGQRRLLTAFEVTPPRRGHVVGHFAWGNFVPTVTVLARRECLEQVGGFPTSHDVSGDYLTWFRIAARHELDYVDRPVADYTVHDQGISSDLGRSLAARIELFSAELDRAPDPVLRLVIERLIFHLGLHLGLAAVRGRARPLAGAWTNMRRALAISAARNTWGWTGRFIVHHLLGRVRRLLRVRRPLDSGPASPGRLRR